MDLFDYLQKNTAMSLRTKLTIFTVGFVLLASLAILAVSVAQTWSRGQSDIQTIREAEYSRLQSNLRSSVGFICASFEERDSSVASPEDLQRLVKRLKRSVSGRGKQWTWVLDTGLTQPAPFTLASAADSSDTLTAELARNLAGARGAQEISFEYPPATSLGADSLGGTSHLLWYAQVFLPERLVLAAGAPLDNVDSIVAERIAKTQSEIVSIIKDRMLFSGLLLLACGLAIFLFSKFFTGPLNRLVHLSEDLASGRRGFSERLDFSSRDEIGRLSASFNAMLSHVQGSMAKLEETAAKYRELVENANSAILHVDRSGQILFLNEFAQKLFGYAPAEVQGRSISETIGKPLEEHTAGEDMFFMPEKYPYLEREHLTRDGSIIWVGWTNRPIYDENGVLTETLCVGSDITKNKESEELAVLQQRKLVQADKMATLGILVSGVAHEINNPNNYIVLNAQTLDQMWQDIRPVLEAYVRECPDYAVAGLPYRQLGDEIPGMLKGISDGALRIKAIVQNLRDFSRLEPDDLTQKVDILKVIEAAQVILANLIKKRTNAFNVSASGPLPPVIGNFQRLEQVVINLLTNACQATDDPAKPINVSVCHQPGRNQISLNIRDRGRGISAHNMRRIFDPFFTTKREEGGTGLGLAISYSIVKDHGGELRIDSKEGAGTSVTLLLPAGPIGKE